MEDFYDEDYSEAGDELMDLVCMLKIEAREYDKRNSVFLVTPFYKVDVDEDCKGMDSYQAYVHSRYCHANMPAEHLEIAEEFFKGVSDRDVFEPIKIKAKDIRDMTDVELCSLIRKQSILLQ